MFSKLAFASFLGLTLAQTTVLTLTVLGGDIDDGTSSAIFTTTSADPDNYFASVIGVSNDVTSMQVVCSAKPGAKVDPVDDYCAGGVATWVYGPKTFSLEQSYSGSLYATFKCDYSSFTGSCTESVAGFTTQSESAIPGTTDAGAVSPRDFTTQLLTVTAGADKLGPVTGSASPASSATSSGPAKTGSAAGSSAGSATGSAAPPKKTNAAAGNAVAMGGALLGAAAGVFGGLL